MIENCRVDDCQKRLLVAALKDIAHVGEHGSPVEGKDPFAVSKWCADRAKEALGAVSTASIPESGK